MAALCHAWPLTEYHNVIEATPSGSWATTETATFWPASGVTGLWPKSLYVGPMLASKAVFCAPGVPTVSGTSKCVVRGSRLKYSRELSWFEPPTHLARSEISYVSPELIVTKVSPSLSVVSA